jgi:hypothetical protein
MACMELFGVLTDMLHCMIGVSAGQLPATAGLGGYVLQERVVPRGWVIGNRAHNRVVMAGMLGSIFSLRGLCVQQ